MSIEFTLAKWEAEQLVQELLIRPNLWRREGLRFTRFAAHRETPRYEITLRNGLPNDMYTLTAVELRPEPDLVEEVKALLRRLTTWGERIDMEAVLWRIMPIRQAEQVALCCASKCFAPNTAIIFETELASPIKAEPVKPIAAATPAPTPTPRSRYLQNLLRK